MTLANNFVGVDLEGSGLRFGLGRDTVAIITSPNPDVRLLFSRYIFKSFFSRSSFDSWWLNPCQRLSRFMSQL